MTKFKNLPPWSLVGEVVIPDRYCARLWSAVTAAHDYGWKCEDQVFWDMALSLCWFHGYLGPQIKAGMYRNEFKNMLDG